MPDYSKLILAAQVALALIVEHHGSDHMAAHLLTDALESHTIGLQSTNEKGQDDHAAHRV